MSEEIDLKQLFPDMEPITTAPTLYLINGCGLKLSGQRNVDPQTGTYLSTQCFVLLFIPIFCLKTFRIAQAEGGGWYFLGREPLSWLAKSWNIFVLTSITFLIGGIWWMDHTSSPEYKTGQMMAEAEQLENGGNWKQAAFKYQEAASHTSSHRPKAIAEFSRILKEKLPDASIGDARECLQRSVNVQKYADAEFATRVIHEYCAATIENHRAEAPADCHGLIKVVDPLVAAAKDPGASREWVTTTSRELLEAAVDSKNSPIDLVVELALVLEEEGNLERCEEVLQARKDDLGATEGARMLGQMYSRRGDIDNAYTLLMPYMKERLNQLQNLNQQVESTYERIQNAAISDLQRGMGGQSFYDKYDSSSEDEQKKMVNEFIMARIQNDSQLKQLQQQIMDLSGAIPAAIDLGILQLQRARQESDPAKRKEELKQAEETFLAVRGQVGETDSYKLFLGQVYFWMERQDEGRALFDELLKNNPSAELKLRVASVYREIGSVAEARTLCEKLWQESTDEKEKHSAATLRSLLQTSVDDQILWLKRCDQSNDRTKTELNWAMAQKAQQDGNDEEAVRLYNLVVKAYAKGPENAGSLNNEALAWFALAGLTEDTASFDRGLEKMERAMALLPDDSILLGNCTDAILRAAVKGIVKDQIELNSLPVSEAIGLVRFLYLDSAGFDRMAAQLRDHAGIRRAVENYEKLTVLAPRSADAWAELLSIYGYLDQDDKIADLWSRLQNADLDYSNTIRQVEEYNSGRMDAAIRTQSATKLESLKTLITDRRSNPDLTCTVAIDSLIETNNSLRRIGDELEHTTEITMAEEAYAKVPSHALAQQLTSSYVAAVFDDLRKTSSPCQKVHQEFGRELSGASQLILAIEADSSVAQAAKQHPLFERYVAAVRQWSTKFPESGSARRQKLLNLCGEAQLAAELLRRLKTSETDAIRKKIETSLYPRAANVLLERFWFCELVGDAAGVSEVRELIQKSHATLVPRLKM